MFNFIFKKDIGIFSIHNFSLQIFFNLEFFTQLLVLTLIFNFPILIQEFFIFLGISLEFSLSAFLKKTPSKARIGAR